MIFNSCVFVSVHQNKNICASCYLAVISNTSMPEYMSVGGGKNSFGAKDPTYMQVLDTPKEYLQIVGGDVSTYSVPTHIAKDDTDSLYQYMEVMDSPNTTNNNNNNNSDYLHVLQSSKLSKNERKVKGSSFYQSQQVVGLHRMTPDVLVNGPTPDLETIAANFPTTSVI